MNFVILFLFSTIIFTVNSESTKDNSHTISEKNAGNLKGRNGATNDNGEKAYENKNERVSDHSVSNSNGKKCHNEDKSMDTHAKEIEAEIEEMPKEDQAAAYKIHAKWSGRAKGAETKLREQLKRMSNALWCVRIRSAIEKFEDDLAKNANVEFPRYKEEKNIHMRRRIFRERKWKWIFENKPNEYRVKTLVAKINASKDNLTIDEFPRLIARAFSELSEYIHQELLRPGTGTFIVKYASSDVRVNRAVELFMDLFEIRDIIVIPKQITPIND